VVEKLQVELKCSLQTGGVPCLGPEAEDDIADTTRSSQVLGWQVVTPQEDRADASGTLPGSWRWSEPKSERPTREPRYHAPGSSDRRDAIRSHSIDGLTFPENNMHPGGTLSPSRFTIYFVLDFLISFDLKFVRSCRLLILDLHVRNDTTISVAANWDAVAQRSLCLLSPILTHATNTPSYNRVQYSRSRSVAHPLCH
jgi:hypothetical protein